MSLRMRSAVSFDLWKRFFLLLASFKSFPSFFSCPLTTQSDLKVFHVASTMLKALYMHWQDQFPADPCHLTLSFIVDNWTYQTKFWPCRPANNYINKTKGKMEESLRACNLTKKCICVFFLHIASMPRIMHPDVWRRVNTQNVSIRHV